MNRGNFNNTPPVRGFFTPTTRPPNPEQQRNTVNIPFYRDTHTYNRNFGGHSNSPNFNRRGGGGGFHQDNRRFNNNHFTPRHNRPHFHRGGGAGHGGGGRDNVDISQFYHPSMLEDPWKDLIDDADYDRERERSRCSTNTDNVDKN